MLRRVHLTSVLRVSVSPMLFSSSRFASSLSNRRWFDQALLKHIAKKKNEIPNNMILPVLQESVSPLLIERACKELNDKETDDDFKSRYCNEETSSAILRCLSLAK